MQAAPVHVRAAAIPTLDSSETEMSMAYQRVTQGFSDWPEGWANVRHQETCYVTLFSPGQKTVKA